MICLPKTCREFAYAADPALLHSSETERTWNFRLEYSFCVSSDLEVEAQLHKDGDSRLSLNYQEA